ncbi:MAG: hypothetical protein IKM47_06450 [Bacteroidaceae bacterium]|nr:hypothetical protein [Bacteroidaceae bacterium]
MTREEQIEKAAQKCEWISKSLNLQSAFTEGANWADKTMLDRACKWLQDGGYFVNSNETIEDFRKAMEGGNDE